MNNNYLVLCVLSFLSILYLYPLVTFSPVQSQQGGGLQITPIVQWSENVEGMFSYCAYEGTVTLDSLNDPQAFCVIPTAEVSFENMKAFVDDGIDNYELKKIETPSGLFKDGATYSICVAFTPQSQNAGFSTAESCQQFTNKKGSHPEEPFINLDDGVKFTNNQ
ncbi:hypothetical protein [Candidatus Nitrosocosmicus sp. SS]|jgi:hypothetical protein|uniref:hypothetical protein n=1 Tax=Candidatus Nitrosocosmicus agrestis TaxID=2563600 RepID=UPI00122E092C|nr:hypothetical protein [Candidatus Nitrosocosmicus sp. SS]KAA2283168.1 hypothetical protein F1Z66_03560 [Candidatus Nitrosocosmicus sp. SS]KAF0868623.1 hypothetical protein E5N71_09585 [Candidatus Nitrosocosmicus sp. SS]